MKKVKIGIIGGTGLYQMTGVQITDSVFVDTPFGKPSDCITIARVGETEAAFLPRHGVGHRFLPSEIPVKANIWALKYLGVERIISVSAVGSLKEEIRPRDIVIPSQIVDRTKGRPSSFFGGGVVGHISFADPFCPTLSGLILQAGVSLGYRAHNDQTYVCMEGPAFSTRAESALYRSWGGGVIGMTALPEAKLAREAEICYAMIALSTDYDCWKEGEEAVTIEMVFENLKVAQSAASAVIGQVVGKIPEERGCPCATAARYAIATDKRLIPDSVKKDLDLLFGKYWTNTVQSR
jgi:5'-methylthioadenosine phosphorylase